MENTKTVDQWFALMEAHLIEAKAHWEATKKLKKFNNTPQALFDCNNKCELVKQSASMIKSYTDGILNKK